MENTKLNEELQPEVKVSYSRVLKVTSPLMYGEDVRAVQNKLNSLGHNAGTVDGYYYFVAAQDMGEIGMPYKIADNQVEYELILGSESSQMPVCFLSSRGVGSGSSIADFGPGAVVTVEGIGVVAICDIPFGFFDSDGNELDNGACVRSVVSLESGVTIQQVPKE